MAKNESVKTKTLKLNIEKAEDKMIYDYLETKSFTDVVKQALKLYMEYLDPEIIQRKQLETMQAMMSGQAFPQQIVQGVQQVQPAPQAEIEIPKAPALKPASLKSDFEEF